jgi:UDP-N-acetylmuramyl pentapeptide phosphotransferase/UDP-N-acetylglucosamine-1-phosphate transferase
MMIERPAVMFVLAAAASSLVTLGWIRYARARQIEDQPGRRRLHEKPTPRGGGIAIALVLLVALAWIHEFVPDGGGLPGLAAGVALFASLGLIDDLFPMPAIGKFTLQLAAGMVMIVALTQGWGLEWIVVIALILACCYVVNIWNFMDGSNGMISVQALLIALALGFWPDQPAALRLCAFALAGACTGFLPFNLPTARVFLGDVGSHALGAAVFGLLLLSWDAGTISPAQSLLMSSVLLLDSGFTLARRVLAGRPVWRAHREHLYQYAVRQGYSHAKVCGFYAAATCLTIAVAAVAPKSRLESGVWGLLFTSWLIGALVYYRLRRNWLQPGTGRARRDD